MLSPSPRPTGLWKWDAGAWTQLSGVNADYVIAANTTGGSVDGIVGDFVGIGMWRYDSGAWMQRSGVNTVYMISADVNGDGKDEIGADS